MEQTEKKKRVSPAQFVQEVRQEMTKVTWPTRKETLISAGMVMVLVLIAALFFMLVDAVISTGVQWLLRL